MKEAGFAPIDYDPLLYYKKNVLILIYLSDGMVLIDKNISDLTNSTKNFGIDDKGDVSDVFGY